MIAMYQEKRETFLFRVFMGRIVDKLKIADLPAKSVIKSAEDVFTLATIHHITLRPLEQHLLINSLYIIKMVVLA